MAIDRQRLGESLVKGPFTAIYPGGLYARDRLLRQGLRPSTIPTTSTRAKAELEKAGLKDTDGDGFVNFPTARRRQASRSRSSSTPTTDRQEPRRRHRRDDGAARHPGHPRTSSPATTATRRSSRANSTGMVMRNDQELVIGGAEHQPARPGRPADRLSHRAKPGGELDLMHFEKQMVDDLVNKFSRHRRRRQARSRRSRTSRRSTPRTSTASA